MPLKVTYFGTVMNPFDVNMIAQEIWILSIF